MGTTCLTVCPECSRHLRCGERACPFCGARVTSSLRVLEYRIKTRLDRGRAASLGAALAAAGFVTSCSEAPTPQPAYGAPCNPPSCTFPSNGGTAGGPALNVGGAPPADGGESPIGGSAGQSQEQGGQGSDDGSSESAGSGGDGGSASGAGGSAGNH